MLQLLLKNAFVSVELPQPEGKLSEAGKACCVLKSQNSSQTIAQCHFRIAAQPSLRTEAEFAEEIQTGTRGRFNAIEVDVATVQDSLLPSS